MMTMILRKSPLACKTKTDGSSTPNGPSGTPWAKVTGTTRLKNKPQIANLDTARTIDTIAGLLAAVDTTEEITADARENGGLDEIADVRGDIMMTTIRQKKLRLGPRSFKIFFSKLKTIWQKWTTTFSMKIPKKQLVRRCPITSSIISTIRKKQSDQHLSLTPLTSLNSTDFQTRRILILMKKFLWAILMSSYKNISVKNQTILQKILTGFGEENFDHGVYILPS